MAAKRKHHLKRNKSFALAQARRNARIRRLKLLKNMRAARHAMFFTLQQG